MPPPIPVFLAGYNPQWPDMAAGHAERLRVLGPILIVVHHIGSTSVPGLIAKPIIDLMPLVTDLAGLDRERRRVEALGYDWHGEFGISGGAIARFPMRPVLASCSFISLLPVRRTSSAISLLEIICAPIRRPLAHTRKRSAARATFIPTIHTPIPMRRLRGFRVWKPKPLLGFPSRKPRGISRLEAETLSEKQLQPPTCRTR
jgi:hypothetical protein